MKLETRRSQPNSGQPRLELNPTGELLIQIIIRQTAAVVVLFAVLLTATLIRPSAGLVGLAGAAILAALVGLVSYYLLRHGHESLGSYIFLITTSLVAVSNTLLRGYQDISAAFILWPILAAILVLKGRDIVVVVGVSALLFFGTVFAQVLRLYQPPFPFDYQAELATGAMSLVVLVVLLGYLSWVASQRMLRTLEQARDTARRVQELNDTLEQRVTERTEELARANEQVQQRAAQLQTSADISAAATSTLDLDELLARVTALLADRFAFYHTAVYLLDATGENAELRAAFCKKAERVQPRGTRIPVGASNFVGYVMATGQPRAAGDLSQDPLYKTPKMQEIRSEITLPLQAGGRIIGALDLECIHVRTFSELSMPALYSLADQIAISIQNALLYQQQSALAEENRRSLERQTALAKENQGLLERSQRAVEELNELNRRLTRETWADYAAARKTELLGQAARLDAGTDGAERPALQSAMEKRDIVTLKSEGHSAVAAPIILRGQVIGSLAVEAADAAEEWKPEDIAVLRDVAEHVALAVENARLFEQTQAALAATQRIAEREARLGQIGDRLHASTDVRAILQTAAEELVQFTGRGRAIVWVPRRDEKVEAHGSGPAAQPAK